MINFDGMSDKSGKVKTIKHERQESGGFLKTYEIEHILYEDHGGWLSYLLSGEMPGSSLADAITHTAGMIAIIMADLKESAEGTKYLTLNLQVVIDPAEGTAMISVAFFQTIYAGNGKYPDRLCTAYYALHNGKPVHHYIV